MRRASAKIGLCGTEQNVQCKPTSIARMLHEFLTSNREELIRRCRAKVRERSSPPTLSDDGVPIFLGQLVDALLDERVTLTPKHDVILYSSRKAAASIESGRTAALHGKKLLDDGYTIDQVVHGYGDVCQAVTELAIETNAPITVAEFHLFNRLLDNAIAEAVTSFGRHRDESIGAAGAQDLHDQMGSLAEQQRDILDTAIRALDALKAGHVGLMGATGTVLEDSLMRLRDLIDKSLPQLRLSSGMTSTPKP
jgi:hypothetical protein